VDERAALSGERVRAALEEAGWRAVEVVPSTGSTNADVAARARGGEPPGLVLVTDDQVAGRGRMARAWVVPPRSSITVSVLLAPRAPIARWGWLPLLTGLAVVRTLVEVARVPAVLKWPNDVLVPAPGGDLGKVCGVLAETAPTPSGPAVVVGAGLNVTQDAGELPVPTATSLRLSGAATTDRELLLAAYLRRLAADVRDWDDAGGDPERSGIGPAYREACTTIGRDVEVHLPGGAPLAGRCEGVDDEGRLLVRDRAGTVHALAAGDVVHVR
jgi:BirA family transcriptional regulator, biotin operon repressor / biotin---[acetyl-CoA-carboxylase] ligase